MLFATIRRKHFLRFGIPLISTVILRNILNVKPETCLYLAMRIKKKISRLRPSDVSRVLIEEVVGHKGIRSVVPPKQWDAFLDSVYAEHFAEIENTAPMYHLGEELPDLENGKIVYSVTDPAKQRVAAEEWIAHTVTGTPPKPSWWKEFLQKIKLFLSKLPGFRNMRWTLDEIETLLARSARAMKRGRWGRESRVEVGGRR